MTLEQRLTGIKEVEPGGFHVQFSFVFKNGATEVASGVGADDGSVRGNACALEVIGGQRSGGNREAPTRLPAGSIRSTKGTCMSDEVATGTPSAVANSS